MRQLSHSFMVAYILSFVKTKKYSKGDDTVARIIDGNDMNLIGDNVKKLRKERNMSQQSLSNKLELLGVYVCRGSVSRIEDKQRTVTDIELFAIAKVLGVTVSELIGE